MVHLVLACHSPYAVRKMDTSLLSQVIPFALAHIPALSTSLPLALSFAHGRLNKYPVAKVLAKYAGVLPIARIAMLELAQAVLTQFGPAPSPEGALQEILAHGPEGAPVPDPVRASPPPPVTMGEIAARVLAKQPSLGGASELEAQAKLHAEGKA